MLDELLSIGNFICAVGTLLLVYAVIKNRKILNGYNLSGSFLTFMALLLFDGWYVMNNQPISFAFGTITVIYWAFVVIFKLIYRGN